MVLGYLKTGTVVSLLLVFVIGFASSSNGQIQSSIVVITDKSSYSEGEIIHITGEVRDLYAGTPVSVAVIHPNGSIAVFDQLSVNSDKKFSTEVTAGGIIGIAGTYIVKVTYGTANRTAETIFEFGGSITTVTGNASGCELNTFGQVPTIVLDDLGFNQIIAGETIVFTGRLVCENGYKHPNVEIIIYENKFGDTDSILVTTFTNTNGEFSVPWVAKTYDSIDSDGTTIQAKFTSLPTESGLHYEPVSEKQTIQIKRLLAELYLDPLPASAEIGEMLFFTGKLGLESGNTEGYVVYIKDEDPYESDDLLATGYVESDGSFSANWIVTKTDDDRTTDVYAVFEGADIYWRVTTCDQGITYQAGGSCEFTIPLQITGEVPPPPPPPPPVPKLDSDGDGIFDDNDQCVNSAENYNGYLDWDGCPDTKPAEPRIIDSDGDGIKDNFDSCPYVKETFNGYQDHDGCPDTIPKPIPKENLVGDEYMKLYYSHSFTKNPVVAIVPTPDSYDEVRKYIIPTQEGVVLWGSELAREFGGDWNVDFIVVEPGVDKFSTKPDIIMNVVTRDEDSRCGVEFAGQASFSRSRSDGSAVEVYKPINIIVCTSGSFTYSTSQVIGISSHEFIHAMGLGHAFNKPGDLMCSVEYDDNNQKFDTCPNSYYSSGSPSDFNLAGVKKLYLEDGWKNPNFPVYSFDDIFTAGQYTNFEYSPPVTPTPTQVTPTPTTPTTEPKDLGLASFVDESKDPQHYIDRYNKESTYKKWFDETYPDITIYDAIGLPQPKVAEIKEPEPKVAEIKEETKFCFLFWCW